MVTFGRRGIKAVCHRRDFRLSVKKTQAKNVVATVKNEKVVYNCINDFILHYIYLLEKAMAPHSSALAWRIPGTAEPGGLQSMGLRRVRHD